VRRLGENLQRLRLQATAIEADALKYQPARLFDAVLLDAPCSSTGTVRRHPDIPWTKSSEDIAKLADLQQRLLAAAVRMVKVGGRVVFSNCSLDPVEGELLVAGFLSGHPDFVLDPVRPGEIAGADPFISQEGTIRTTPADLDLGKPEISGLDGFFAARMLRRR
jgi:16S rRNA (cytosine967-C5)-methyltransferase